MAIYKAVDTEQLESHLSLLADAIRAKTGGTVPLSFPEGMVEELSSAPVGNGCTLSGQWVWNGNNELMQVDASACLRINAKYSHPMAPDSTTFENSPVEIVAKTTESGLSVEIMIYYGLSRQSLLYREGALGRAPEYFSDINLGTKPQPVSQEFYDAWVANFTQIGDGSLPDADEEGYLSGTYKLNDSWSTYDYLKDNSYEATALLTLYGAMEGGSYTVQISSLPSLQFNDNSFYPGDWNGSDPWATVHLPDGVIDFGSVPQQVSVPFWRCIVNNSTKLS